MPVTGTTWINRRSASVRVAALLAAGAGACAKIEEIPESARVGVSGAAGSFGSSQPDDAPAFPSENSGAGRGGSAGETTREAGASIEDASDALPADEAGLVDRAFRACDEGFDGPDCQQRTSDYGRRVRIAEHLADPDVIELSDDRYVLTGTGSSIDFSFLESSDLVAWRHAETYNPSLADPSHDYCFCWAPDIVQVDGTLYFYFSAHRGPKGATTCPPPPGSDVTTYRAVSIDGSLRFGVPELLYPDQGGAHSRTESGCPAGGCGLAIRIDPTIYDGRLYYVFFNGGNNIASVSLTNPSDWRYHTGPAGWALNGFEERINEAPELLERDGRAYLFFSAAWFDSQYATFYVSAGSPSELTRDLPLHRLTTPVRRGDGTLAETHGHNSITTRRGETFNFFHVGVFDGAGSLIRRDTYRQRIVWNPDGTAVSQNEVRVSWPSLGGANEYSLDVVLRDGSVIGPCIAVWRIHNSTSTVFNGICPDAADRLVHKSEVQAFRLYATAGGPFVPVGEAAYDGYSDQLHIAAGTP